MDTSKNRSRRREERNLEDGVLLGLHLGIYLTFGSDFGRIACGMIAWFGPGWITFYKEGKKHHFRRWKFWDRDFDCLEGKLLGDYKDWAGNVHRVT